MQILFFRRSFNKRQDYSMRKAGISDETNKRIIPIKQKQTPVIQIFTNKLK